jgi:hypothetical protein
MPFILKSIQVIGYWILRKKMLCHITVPQHLTISMIRSNPISIENLGSKTEIKTTSTDFTKEKS